MNNNDDDNISNNDEHNNNYIVNNEELYRRIIEDLLINLYINRYNINDNESLPINYYDFYYIYNSYINTYNYDDNIDDNNNLVYNFIVNAYNDYNSILNTINYNFNMSTPTSSVVEAQAQAQAQAQTQTPNLVLESNGIDYTLTDCLHECCSICLCEDEVGENDDTNDKNSSCIKSDEIKDQLMEPETETDDFKSSSTHFDYVKTSCNHDFHLNCLAKWVGNNKKTCPLCRHNLQQAEAIQE